LWPLDIAMIEASVKRTGRTVVLHEAPRTCGFGAEIAALIQERCFLHMKAPVARVTGYDTPFPYALEKSYLPDPERTLRAIRAAMEF
jgi:2-oxoisovalerate dehydrogenase E1 component beta subunit